ncbi:MAG: bifunctional methylenetetrahydrofolate dehydrogenase/methenyltetrahydrofolate cyclohydrolase FolD [Pseudolysinimonas sp.]
MTAVVIDGREVAATVRHRTAERAAAFTARTGRAPGLATLLVGDDPASDVYVANKRRLAAAAGIDDFHRHLPADATAAEVAAAIEEFAADPAVSGILLQLPLPAGLDSSELIDRIPVAKDVDGLTTLSQGLLARDQPGLRACTPSGVIELLDAAGIELAGAEAVVVGRSELVGRPMAQLLLQRNATVTMAHSRTRDLAAVTSRADIIVAAAGVAGIIRAEHVKPGATVIDVGIHRTEHGLVGDVAFDEVAPIAGWITQVPGGVGPMTIAMLLANTVTAAEAAAEAAASVES